jgi:hypothetical protein
MTDVTFDQQNDARIGFGEGADTPMSAKPAALRHKPSSRTQLICRWHRSARGPLTCTWTKVPSTPLGARDVQLPDLGSGFETGDVPLKQPGAAAAATMSA